MTLESILAVLFTVTGVLWGAAAIYTSISCLRWYWEGYPDAGESIRRVKVAWVTWQALSYGLIALFAFWVPAQLWLFGYNVVEKLWP